MSCFTQLMGRWRNRRGTIKGCPAVPVPDKPLVEALAIKCTDDWDTAYRKLRRLPHTEARAFVKGSDEIAYEYEFTGRYGVRLTWKGTRGFKMELIDTPRQDCIGKKCSFSKIITPTEEDIAEFRRAANTASVTGSDPRVKRYLERFPQFLQDPPKIRSA